MGQGDLAARRLGQEIDDDLGHPLTGLPVEIAHAVGESRDELGVVDPGLLFQFALGGGLRFLTRLDMALGE